jgi:hypothetical protein
VPCLVGDQSLVGQKEKHSPHACENNHEEENDPHVSQEVVIHQQVHDLLRSRVVYLIGFNEI